MTGTRAGTEHADAVQNAIEAHRLAFGCAALHGVLCTALAIWAQSYVLPALIGLPALIVPAMIAWRYPTSLLSRLAMACGFMALTALAIQESGGAIEAHFSVFVMMSVLVVYHDWRPLVLAAGLIIAHHAGFSGLQETAPLFTIWPRDDARLMQLLVHGGAVVAQTVALCHLARMLAQRFGLKTANAALSRSLIDISDEADRDALTGLHNRRHLARRILRLEPQVAAGREPVTLCVVDLDHFKQVNDRHGHPAGDEVLRAVADVLSASIDRGDGAVRFGGEEFLLILRGGTARAFEVVEALRRRLAANAIATTYGPVAVTVSLGLATWTPAESFHAAYCRADRALYAAKGAGRNRIVVAEEPEAVDVRSAA